MKTVAYRTHNGIAYALHADGEIYSRRLGTGTWTRVRSLLDLPEVGR